MLIDTEDYFDKHDWDCLHDVVYEVVGVQVEQKYLEELFKTFPQELIGKAITWGMSDTVWCEDVYKFLNEQKIKLTPKDEEDTSFDEKPCAFNSDQN